MSMMLVVITITLLLIPNLLAITPPPNGPGCPRCKKVDGKGDLAGIYYFHTENSECDNGCSYERDDGECCFCFAPGNYSVTRCEYEKANDVTSVESVEDVAFAKKNNDAIVVENIKDVAFVEKANDVTFVENAKDVAFVEKTNDVTFVESATAIPPIEAPNNGKTPKDLILTAIPDVVLLTGGYPKAIARSANVFGRPDCPSFNLPGERSGHSSHYVDGQVLICGGTWRTAPSCLKLQDGEFSTHSQLNCNRYRWFDHVGLILDGKLTLIENLQERPGWYNASLETLTGTTWTDCKNQLYRLRPGTSVWGSCAVALDDKRALVIGGGETAGDQVLMYEVGTGWTELRSLPEKRFFHSCVMLPNGNVLVAGGYDYYMYDPMYPRAKVRDTAIIYQLDQTLELPGRMKTGRAAGQMVNLGGRILFFGGKRSESGLSELDTVEEFHQDTGTWTLLKETMASPRGHFSAVVVPGSAVGC